MQSIAPTPGLDRFVWMDLPVTREPVSRWRVAKADALQFTDRYEALGILYPNPKTMCLGQCEGTGWVPVYLAEGDPRGTVRPYAPEDDAVLIALWREAEVQNPTDDGWHFVKCPDCAGTGQRGGYKRVMKGGPGSGNFGHVGRPGVVGGSSRSFGAPLQRSALFKKIQAADGGFTYDAQTGALKTSGFALSIHPDRGKVLDLKDVNLKALVQFAKDNHDLLMRPESYFGGWNNPDDGKVYLDVATIVETAEEAERLGRESYQIAYFDFALGKSVDIDYTGQQHAKAAREADILRYRRPTHVRAIAGTQQAVDGPGSDTGGIGGSPGTLGRILKGGPGSGNFGHAGRPGAVGGSAQAGGALRAGRTAVSETSQAVGQPFTTDRGGRPVANRVVQAEAQAYNAAHGLPRIDHESYLEVDQLRAGRIADAYEALPFDDSHNPEVQASYEALAREVEAQWTAAKAHGMTFEPDLSSTDAVDNGPYKSSFDVTDDIRNQRHLFFFTGGEPNRFMAVKDAEGIAINDKFRAIHDYYGHAAGGYGFGPRGEEAAWRLHSQMFSPAARRALTTETRGQNSWVNFGRQNYDAEGNYKNIPPADRPYAQQKTALLPEEFVPF